MAATPKSVPHSDAEYDICPAKSIAETKTIWWPFMQSLGWNRGIYDLATYMDPSLSRGMLLAVSRTDDKPVGHVAAIIHGNSTGWVSMFIIDAAYRGKGLGRLLWNAMMDDFKSAGTAYIGLDGVTEQKKTYERRGFVESTLGSVKVMTRSLVAAKPIHDKSALSQGILLDIREIPFGLLADHEVKYTGFERRRLWTDEHFFHRPDVAGFALCTKNKPEIVEDILAWSVIRRCSSGARVGPVYAKDATCAEEVLSAALRAATPAYIKLIPLDNEPISDLSEAQIASEATLVCEVWTGNPAALYLFQRLGWEEVGVDYNRMWLEGRAPEAQSEGGLAQEGMFAIFDAAVG